MIKKFIGAAGAAAAGLVAMSAVAAAEDKLTFSFNIGGTSDYVFRGVSQGDERPQFQAGVDVGYGIFYVGAWGSGVDPNFVGGSRAEIDFYAGVTPSWGIADFDFGVIYYAYPWAMSSAGVDYWEGKIGVSTDDLVKNLTLGVTAYYSPEYTFKSGEVWTLEGSVAYELSAMGPITPTLSALVGYQEGDNAYVVAGIGNGDDNFTYWNAGVSFAVDKLSFDLRYWDTNMASVGTVPGLGGLADERFVFTGIFTY